MNTTGVGLSMAACVGALCGACSGCDEFSEPAALCTALPTLVVGTAWAVLVRWDRISARFCGLRVGWVLSVPLAILNTSLCAGFHSAYDRDLAEGFLQSLTLLPLATAGILCLLPALAAVLFIFKHPLEWARQQTRRGPASTERGELVVGMVVALLSALALRLASYRFPSGEQAWLDARRDRYGCGIEAESAYIDALEWRPPDSRATVLLVALGVLGLVAGVTATLWAWHRGRARRRFIEQVERGDAAGFRVAEDDRGRRLVRSQGARQYRQTEEEELLLVLEGPSHPRQR